MEGPIRVPPRFVPTLTAVIDLEAEPAPLLPAEPAPVNAPNVAQDKPDVQAEPEAVQDRVFIGMQPRVEPAFPPEPGHQPVAPTPNSIDQRAWASAVADAMPVPEVPEWRAAPNGLIEPRETLAPSETVPDSFKAISPIHEADVFRLEEELLHRVLQRVDLSLEERLTEVVSATVQHQLDAMIPRLRAEVESALRQLVVEAMAHELLENPGSATGSGVPSLG